MTTRVVIDNPHSNLLDVTITHHTPEGTDLPAPDVVLEPGEAVEIPISSGVVLNVTETS